MPNEKHSPISLSLLCTVVSRDREDTLLACTADRRAFFHLMLLGEGTANSRILNYLGLGNTEKAVLLSIVPSHIAGDELACLDAELELAKPGHGICFSTPIHEGCYHLPVEFAGFEETSGGNKVQINVSHELIVVVMNRGYSEEVMDLARAAGATGGTVLHARGCGLQGAEKFFGVTIQHEKELLWILADAEHACGIMAAIGEKAGPGTDADAVSFSMPADNVMGLRAAGAPGADGREA